MTPINSITMSAMFPVSHQMLADYDNVFAWALNDEMSVLWREMELDATYGWGTRHRPDRRELWEVRRPERVRENVRHNLATCGLDHARWGKFVRADK